MTNDTAVEKPITGAAPLWNIISIALPLGGFALLAIMAMTTSRGGGDFAGALGTAVLILFGSLIACGLGALAAIVGLARGERLMWLTVIGLVGNGIVLLSIGALLL